MSEAALLNAPSTTTAPPMGGESAPLDTMTAPPGKEALFAAQKEQTRDFLKKAMESTNTAPAGEQPTAQVVEVETPLFDQLKKAATDAPKAADSTIPAAEAVATDAPVLRDPIEELMPASAAQDGVFDPISAAAAINTITDPTLRKLATEGFKAQMLASVQPAQAPAPVAPQAEAAPAAQVAPATQADPAQAYNDAMFNHFVAQFENAPASHFGNSNAASTIQILKAAFEGKPILYEAPANATPQQKQQVDQWNRIVTNKVNQARETASREAKLSIMEQRLAAFEQTKTAPAAENPAARQQDLAREVSDLLVKAVDVKLKVPHVLDDGNVYRDVLVDKTLKQYGKMMSDPKYAPHATTPEGRQTIMASALFNTMQNFPALAGSPRSAAPAAAAPAKTAAPAQINVDGSASASVTPAAAAKVSSPITLNPGGLDHSKQNGESAGSILGDDLNAKQIFGPQGTQRIIDRLRATRR